MKRRLTPILTISIALLLIGSLAYAADKRKQARSVHQSLDTTREEEALKTELLDAVEEHRTELADAGDAGNVGDDRSNEKKARVKSSKLSRVTLGK